MDALITEAFKQGGMALAFIVILFAYRELWTARTKDLLDMIKSKDDDRKLLISALEANTKALASLDNNLNNNQNENKEIRSDLKEKTSNILEELQKQTTELNNHRIREERIMSGKVISGVLLND